MKNKKKDPQKVAAGRKGGRLSGGNWKNNRENAAKAGRMSAWKRNSGKLEDYPLEYEDMPLKLPKGAKRSLKRRSRV